MIAKKLLVIGAFVAAGLVVLGCSSKEGGGADKPAAKKQTTPMDPEIAKALAQLSPEDRAKAETQKICPVTDKQLGVMGKPVKVTVKEQEVFLCCDACIDKIESDPDKYLAKLKK